MAQKFRGSFSIFFLTLCALPIVIHFLGLSDYALHVAVVCLYYILMSSSWNLVAGFSSQLSFAHAAFAALGAYGSGLLATRGACPIWLSVLGGTALGTLSGLVLGALCLRLNGIYLSLLSLAFSEVVRLLAVNEAWLTRGTMGLAVPGLFHDYSKPKVYGLFALLTFCVLLGTRRLLRSNFGLHLRALSNDEEAAASLGVATGQLRVLAFILSAFVAALTGAIYGHFLMVVSPDFGSLNEMFLILAMAVVGGLGTVFGPLMGACLLELLSEGLRGLGQAHILVFALIALLLFRYRPRGLVGFFTHG